MLRFLKGNKELRVDEHYKNEYLSNGWALINDKGEVLESAKAKDGKEKIVQLESQVATLTEELEESEKECDALVNKVKELEAANKQLEAANKKLTTDNQALKKAAESNK